jgi:hypothetical protein
MGLRHRSVLAGITDLIVAAGAKQMVASAGSPDPISVSPGTSGTYTGAVGPGWPDPNGPPAPSSTCATPSNQCDRETVILTTSGFSSPPNTFSLAVTVTYTASDPAGHNCLDVAIEDSSATTVLASQRCVGSGTTVTALNTPAGTYSVEIDADGILCCAITSQPFSATATGEASVFEDPAYLGGPAAFNGTAESAEPATEPANAFVPYSGQPLVLQGHMVGREAGEPAIAVDSGGNVFFDAAAFDTPGGILARTKYLVSSNSGQTWDDITRLSRG